MTKQGDCFVPRNDVQEDCFVPRNDEQKSQWRRESHLCASLRENPAENFKLNKKHQGFRGNLLKLTNGETRRLLRSSQWRRESRLCASLRENPGENFKL